MVAEMRPRSETLCPFALAHSLIACVCSLSGRVLVTAPGLRPRRAAGLCFTSVAASMNLASLWRSRASLAALRSFHN
jgi:hypothetical protein